jgi:hypothetical protein
VQPIHRSRRGTKPGRDGRAPQGANKQRIIAAVMQDPGVTATENRRAHRRQAHRRLGDDPPAEAQR